MTQLWESPKHIFWNKSSLRTVTLCLRTYFVIKPEISHKTYMLKNNIDLSLAICGLQPSETDVLTQIMAGMIVLTQERALGWAEWDLNAVPFGRGLQGLCRRDSKAMLSASAWIAVGVRKHASEGCREQYIQTGPVLEKEHVCLGDMQSCLETVHMPP